MKRGTIVIGGLVRDFAGLQMKGGTIVLLSGAELRTGAWMNRGTIVSLKPIPLLPSFLYAATYNPDVPAPLREAPAHAGDHHSLMTTRTAVTNATRATRRFRAEERFLCGSRMLLKRTVTRR